MGEAPLRILQVLRAPVGGLFRHVSDLSRDLAARGHQIGVVVDSLSADGLTRERLQQLAPYAALGIHSLPMPRTLGPGDLTAPFAIRRLADSLAIEVVHGHGAKGGMNARWARIGRRGRVALYTPHGGMLHYPPRSPAGMLFRLIERALLSATDALIFESRFAQQAFFSQIGEPDLPAPVIHNGLQPEEFEPVALTAEPHDFVFIGELREIKGVPQLIEALVEVRAPGGRPATLVMAGDGPLMGETKAQIVRLGLEQRVRLLGATPARQALAMGRCAVVPSLAESLPYVVLEATAAGRPVIATRVGGIAEIFGPTADCLLPAGDVPALQRALQGFLDDPAAAERAMGQRLDFIREGFSVARMTEQIEALYRAALSRRGG